MNYIDTAEEILEEPPTKLGPREFIVRTQGLGDVHDYFLVKAIEHPFIQKYTLTAYDINIDKWLDFIKTLYVEFSTNKVTIYVDKDVRFKTWWKSLRKNWKFNFNE